MKSAPARAESLPRRAATVVGSLTMVVVLSTGCWAPLRSHGVPARSLPDEYRIPMRTAGEPMNYAHLTISPPADYLLGAGDVLEIAISGLYPQSEINPLKAQVMSNGTIDLPMIGTVRVDGMNLVDAQRAISDAYADGFLKDPRVRLSLFQKATVSVVVLGEVKQPGAVVLFKYENDVGHAIAAAQGLAEDAADIVEVHRRPVDAISMRNLGMVRIPPTEASIVGTQPSEPPFDMACARPASNILTIPLRGPAVRPVPETDVVLKSGDVVIIPSRRHEVFYVVGRLRTTNAVRFTVGNRDRELGIGFILPRDREIDVVTAVAMAGYIDPIDSPTTVTVHRVSADGRPTLITVDLIAARYDRRETVLVQPGDIIYLNPDANWWWRYTLDRVMPQLITIPYADLFRP